MEGFEILVSGEFARWMKSEGFLQEFMLSPKGEAQLRLKWQRNIDNVATIAKGIGFRFRVEKRLDDSVTWQVNKEKMVGSGVVGSLSEALDEIVECIGRECVGFKRSLEWWEKRV